MKKFDLYSRFRTSDMTLLYFREKEIFTLCLIPTQMEEKLACHRETLAGEFANDRFGFNFPAYAIESMLQFKVSGDIYPAQHTADVSMRNSGSIDKLKFLRQYQSGTSVVTEFDYDSQLKLKHVATLSSSQPFILIHTEAENIGEKPVKLEYLASFSLGMLSPFESGEGSETYRIHRFSSNWSAECRHEARFAEEHSLEMSWQGAGTRSLRFGNIGSMPVRPFYPFAAVEDTPKSVFWGAEIAAIGQWELEVSRYCDFLNLSGGMTDREFGQWSKTLPPGANFRTQEAIVSCVKGSLEDLTMRLGAYLQQESHPMPEAEKQLPWLFNDWCSYWGDTGQEKLLALADKLQDCQIKYFVVDAGWFSRKDNPAFESSIGDWDIATDRFPDMAAFTQALRQKGFIPGIWFEFENITKQAKIAQKTDWLLKLDGHVIHQGDRSFLDFRNPEVWQYLDEKLIAFLKKYQFGYLKVDYNSSTGWGCDGEDAPAEELRKHLENVEAYFHHLREELPELVIEICSSGGHRLSPGWMKLSSMGCFSDTHENVDIPIVAANTGMFVPMRKLQIWATLRKLDDDKRLHYSLAAAMPGRPCLSGDIAELSSEQMAVVHKAARFYSQLHRVIQNGHPHVERQLGLSWTHPEGFQYQICESGDEILLILHTYKNSPKTVDIPLKNCKITDTFCENQIVVQITPDTLHLGNLSDFTGVAVLLKRK